MKNSWFLLLLLHVLSINLYAGTGNFTGSAKLEIAADLLKVSFLVTAKCYENSHQAMKASEDATMKLKEIWQSIEAHKQNSSKLEMGEVMEEDDENCRNAVRQNSKVTYTISDINNFPEIFEMIDNQILDLIDDDEILGSPATFVTIESIMPWLSSKNKHLSRSQLVELAYQNMRENFLARVKASRTEDPEYSYKEKHRNIIFDSNGFKEWPSSKEEATELNKIFVICQAKVSVEMESPWL